MFDWPARMKTLMPFGSLSQVWNWPAVPLPSGWPAPLARRFVVTVKALSIPSAEAKCQGDGLAVPAEHRAGHRDRSAAILVHV